MSAILSAQSKRYITYTHCLMWYDILVPLFFIKAFRLLFYYQFWEDERESKRPFEMMEWDVWRVGCLYFVSNALLTCRIRAFTSKWLRPKWMIHIHICLYYVVYMPMYTTIVKSAAEHTKWKRSNSMKRIQSCWRVLQTIFVSTN